MTTPDIPTEALEAATDVVPAPLIGADAAGDPQQGFKIFGPGPTPLVLSEALEAAAQAVHDLDCPEGYLHEQACGTCRKLTAAAAPHLIAEGRRQAMQAIREHLPPSYVEWAERVVEGTDGGPSPAEPFATAEARAEIRTRRSNVLGAEWAAQIEAAEVDHD